MRTKRPKAAQPSLLEELSKPLRDFVTDFKTHGADVLQKVRQDNPEKYLELSTKLLPLIAALNPASNEYTAAKTKEEIGAALLKSIGFPDADEVSVQEAVKLNDEFVDALQAIRARAEGQLQ
jgi:hypothetical protein